MSKKNNKPLPQPHSTPFGKKKPRDNDDKNEENLLMTDRIAMALSEGKLEEFLQQEMPDSEYAKKLTEMAMGMTGIMPQEGRSSDKRQQSGDDESEAGSPSAENTSGSLSGPPEDVIEKAEAGDMSGVMEVLKREHNKRTGGTRTDETSKGPSSDRPTVEKEVIDQLARISSENNLSLDWLMLRALKLYVQKYQQTGDL